MAAWVTPDHDSNKPNKKKNVTSHALDSVISHTDWHSIQQISDMPKRLFHHLKATVDYLV